LPKVVTQRCLEQDLNPRPTDRKPKCLTRCATAPPIVHVYRAVYRVMSCVRRVRPPVCPTARRASTTGRTTAACTSVPRTTSSVSEATRRRRADTVTRTACSVAARPTPTASAANTTPSTTTSASESRTMKMEATSNHRRSVLVVVGLINQSINNF